MKLSVVVPAFNEEKLLGDSLAAIQRAMGAVEERGWETELIVCDNNSSDATPDIARAGGATVVFEPVNQISRARNRGAAAAAGDWLLFVDADSRPSRELFEEMSDCILDGRAIAGGCAVRMDRRHRWFDLAAGIWNWIGRVQKWAAGSFIFCERRLFEDLGGFSRELFAAEEIDLFRRIKREARKRRRTVVILRRNALETSARKVQLYSAREMLTFFCKTILGLGRPLKDKEVCHNWYDGRR